MEDSNPIKVEVDGITFLSTGRYYDGINQWVSHKLKEGDPDAINYAARKLAHLLPKNAIIVPIPGHEGRAKQTYTLANAISSYTGLPVADVLLGNNREPNYTAKYAGRPLTEDQMGMKQFAPLPIGRVPFLLDNVTDTGTTAKAAVHAIGGGFVLSYAMSDKLLDQSEYLKNVIHY